MKSVLISFCLLIVLSNPLFGHKWCTSPMICPICNDTINFKVYMSYSTNGCFMDLEKKSIANLYEEKIKTCHTCLYSGYITDFDTFSKTTIRDSLKETNLLDSIKVITSKYIGKNIDNTLGYEIAAEIKMLNDFKNEDIANIYLISSYFLRNDSLQIERRKNMQRNTIYYFSKAIERREYELSEIATIYYLIGDLNRRLGEFEKAVEFFDFALNEKNIQDWLKDFAIKQRKLAINNDDNNNI